MEKNMTDKCVECEELKTERNRYKKKYRKNRLERNKFEQALDKIERIVETGISSSLCNCGLRAMSEDILTIINEVKDV